MCMFGIMTHTVKAAKRGIGETNPWPCRPVSRVQCPAIKMSLGRVSQGPCNPIKHRAEIIINYSSLVDVVTKI